MVKTKKELLDHYSTGDIHFFTQFDGWKIEPNQSDDVMKPDKDGFCLMAGYTEELRRSPKELEVRVFVYKGTPAKNTIKHLKRIVKWIKDDKNILERLNT